MFDEKALKKGRTDQEKSFGIEKVFINGELVLDDGKLDTDKLKSVGRAIRVV